MIYNYLESIISKKLLILCIIIIFISVFVFENINITLKGIFGILIGIFICWFYVDHKITKINDNLDVINNVIQEMPNLESFKSEVDLLFFYYNNKALKKYDIINFDKSIKNAINFIEVYNRINLNTHLQYYQFDILEKHRYLCLEYFRQIEYNIPNQPNIIKHMEDNLKLLNNILSKYIDKILNKLENNKKVTIYSKFNILNKVKEFNKYDYII